MFTQVSFGTFLEGFLDQARERYEVDFADQYPNLAVYTPQAIGLWGFEIVGGFSVRLFRWLRHDLAEIVIPGPYENNETPEEFRSRFEREFWDAVDRLRVD